MRGYAAGRNAPGLLSLVVDQEQRSGGTGYYWEMAAVIVGEEGFLDFFSPEVDARMPPSFLCRALLLATRGNAMRRAREAQAEIEAADAALGAMQNGPRAGFSPGPRPRQPGMVRGYEWGAGAPGYLPPRPRPGGYY